MYAETHGARTPPSFDTLLGTFLVYSFPCSCPATIDRVQIGLRLHLFPELSSLSCHRRLKQMQIIHDFGHKGVTNDYLINTQDNWAICYNDLSPNENFHASGAFRLLLESENNFVAHLPKVQCTRFISMPVHDRSVFLRRNSMVQILKAFTTPSIFATTTRQCGQGFQHDSCQVWR
jgi:hypothetical protein